MTKYEKFDDFIAEEYKDDKGLKKRVQHAGALIDIAVDIRNMREKRGLTQKQLALVIGTSQANIARWEAPGYTEYTISSLMKLSDALDAKVDIKFNDQRITTRITHDGFGATKRTFMGLMSTFTNTTKYTDAVQDWSTTNA